MSQYIQVLERGRYRQIFGYPSALYLLCLHARTQGKNLRALGLKVAFVTGEVLYEYQREVISEVFNCPVANGYGGRDSALIAHECPQGGMHILADALILELVDPQGRPVPPGEAGEIVITDLYSHEAPFIRYGTGDVAVLSPRKCRCGRSLPMLEQVEGRSNDTIVAPDGRMINSLALIGSSNQTPQRPSAAQITVPKVSTLPHFRMTSLPTAGRSFPSRQAPVWETSRRLVC